MEISAITPRYNIATKSQYEAYPSTMTNTYPAYAEEEAPKSSSMLGATILGLIGIAGIGYGISRHMKVGDLTKELTAKKGELEKAVKELTESKEAHETTKKAYEKSQKEVNELKEAAKKKFSWSSLIFWKNWGKKKA